MLEETKGGMRMPWGWESVKGADPDTTRALEVYIARLRPN